MPKLLKIDEIETVGFVDDGANQLADIVIWKRQQEEEQTMKKDGKLATLMRAVGATIGWTDAEVDAAVGELVAEEGDMGQEFDVSALPDDAQKAWAEVEKRATEAEEKATAAEGKVTEAEAKVTELEKAAEPKKTDEDVLKALPEAAQAIIRKAQAEAEAATKAATEAMELAKSERTARRQAEFRKEADEHLSGLPGSADDKVTLLEAVEALPEEQRKLLREQLHSASVVGKTARVFAEDGTEGGDDSASALGKINAQASELAKKDDNLTFEQAFDHILKSDRELAKAYAAERDA